MLLGDYYDSRQFVLYYRTSGGKFPFREWFDGLKDRMAQAKIDVQLGRLRCGNFGKWRSVGEGILELKIDFGPGYRIYLGRDGLTAVILLCGGSKGSQDQDLLKARSFWNDYKKRKKQKRA